MLQGNKSRVDLQTKLISVLEKVTYNRNTYKKIEKYFLDKNFTKGQIAGMLNGSIPLVMLSDTELCLLATQINYYAEGSSDKELIEPTKFFTDYEIQIAKDYKIIKIIDESNKITFTHVTQTNPRQYICASVSLQQIQDIILRGLYEYNPETQRQMTKKILRDKIVKEVTVIPSKVQEIKETLLNNQPLTNIISINIPFTGKENIKFNEDKGILQIEVDENTRIHLIDGFHRFVAIAKTLEENPKLQYNFIFNIFNYNHDMALQFVLNQNKQTPFEELYVQTVSKEDEYMVMVQDINNFGNEKINSLYKRIGEDYVDVEFDKAFTVVGVFARAIKQNFDPRGLLDNFERAKIKNFLLNGYIYILGILKKEFDDKQKQLDTSVVTHPNTFIGYTAILSKLYNDAEWENKIFNIFEKINFDKNQEVWNNLNLFSHRITDNNIEKISNYFKQFL